MTALIVGNAVGNDLFRERTHRASPPIVLRPKRCACGRQAYAKQLKQYGKCIACVRAAIAAPAEDAA